MSFLNHRSDGKKMVDKVFKAALKAKQAKKDHGAEAVVDATLGTLFDENGVFVAFDSVWEPFNTIDNIQKAKYASSIQGNPNYRTAVYEWLFGTEEISCEIIVTPGGAGAVSSTMKNILDPGQTVIKPSLAWGPYNTMAYEFGLTTTNYNLFKKNQFDMDNFKHTCKKVMKDQGKVLAIINDPCHNPSGYTMRADEWEELISFVNNLSKEGPVILLHDIAYVDFTTNPVWKKQLLQYKNIAENVMVVIAFSLSKTFTAYGARIGAAVAITPNKQSLDNFKDAEIYSARSIWSTVNNSMMELFPMILNNPELKKAYLKEKQFYVDLIKERADIFISESKAVGLDLYPYKEGFFATIKMENNSLKEHYNQLLADNNIYTVEVDLGLRVALCSVPKHKLVGLAKRIKTILK